MAVNFPSSNNSSATERLTPNESKIKVKDTSLKDEPVKQETAVPMTISNLFDLKQAELRGANYTISDEQLVKAIEKAVHAMQGRTTSLEFSVHEQTKLISVKVKDAATGEIIREIPPEKTLDLVAKLWEMAGIFIDEKR